METDDRTCPECQEPLVTFKGGILNPDGSPGMDVHLCGTLARRAADERRERAWLRYRRWLLDNSLEPDAADQRRSTFEAGYAAALTDQARSSAPMVSNRLPDVNVDLTVNDGNDIPPANLHLLNRFGWRK